MYVKSSVFPYTQIDYRYSEMSVKRGFTGDHGVLQARDESKNNNKRPEAYLGGGDQYPCPEMYFCQRIVHVIRNRNEPKSNVSLLYPLPPLLPRNKIVLHGTHENATVNTTI